MYNHLEKSLPDGEHFPGYPDEYDLTILLECRRLKESISKRDQAGISVLLENRKFQKILTRDEFEHLIQPDVDKSIALLKEMLQNLHDAKYPVQSLILIGGSSRIPLFCNNIRKTLDITPLETASDDSAVALGAAVDFLAIEQKKRMEAEQKKQEVDEKRRQELALAFQAVQRGEYGEAMSRFRNLAMQGEAEAQYQLGCLYRDGRGTARNLNEAIQWFEKAAEHSHAKAIFDLAMAYIADHRPSWAIPRLQILADQQDPLAMFELGYSYKEGRGTPRNDELARKWLHAVAELDPAGRPDLGDIIGKACYHYARMLEAGAYLSPSSNPKQDALPWMTKANDLGHLGAAAWLAQNKVKDAVEDGLNKAKGWLKSLFKS